MPIEQLFAGGVMTMGSPRVDSNRQAGIFPPNVIEGVAASRAAEIESFRWIAGE